MEKFLLQFLCILFGHEDKKYKNQYGVTFVCQRCGRKL